MKTKILTTALLIIFSVVIYAQTGVINNGAKIIVTSGAIINITGGTAGDFTNATNGANDGSVDIDGTIKLTGDWANNATNGTVFVNPDTDGEVVFNGVSAQAIKGNQTNFEKLTLDNSSGLNLNTNTPDKLFTVNGDARITGDLYYGVLGSLTQYLKPDFVFSKKYKLHKINDIEKFINKNGHLPWVTSAKDEKNGVNITRMTFETLESVENQQLQIIKLKKENDSQQIMIEDLLKRIEKLERKTKNK